jgi:hypothetical protein
MALLLAACSPLDQGAVTLDESTQLPKLVMALCDGEGVEAVRLTTVHFDGNVYEEGRALWRIEATKPVPLESVVAGQVPDGFHEVVALPERLPGGLLMVAETDGGTAARQGGEFRMSELKPGVLMQSGERTSAASLRRSARMNCSPGVAQSLGLPSWLDTVALVGIAATLVAGLAYAVMRTLGRRNKGAA